MQAAFIHWLSSSKVAQEEIPEWSALGERFEKKDVEVKLDENWREVFQILVEQITMEQVIAFGIILIMFIIGDQTI